MGSAQNGKESNKSGEHYVEIVRIFFYAKDDYGSRLPNTKESVDNLSNSAQAYCRDWWTFLHFTSSTALSNSAQASFRDW
jgi:hypothetical protein